MLFALVSYQQTHNITKLTHNQLRSTTTTTAKRFIIYLTYYNTQINTNKTDNKTFISAHNKINKELMIIYLCNYAKIN